MLHILLLQISNNPLRPYYLSLENDLVGATFFFSMFALFGGALFFFLERGNVPRRWHANVTLAGIICIVAGINYYYMQGMYLNTGLGPTRFRYADWLFTVPMMCTQFYMLMRPAGAKPASLIRLLLGGVWMIAFGYFGETHTAYWAILWGVVSTLGYFLIIYEVWFGPLAKLADTTSDEEVVRAFNYLGYFIIIGWSIYPFGYMMGAGNLLSGLHIDMNLVYNFGDVINKIGFGFIVYSMARTAGAKKPAAAEMQQRVAA